MVTPNREGPESIIGKCIELKEDNQRGEAEILMYNPRNNAHTIEFKESGNRITLLLHRFVFEFVDQTHALEPSYPKQHNDRQSKAPPYRCRMSQNRVGFQNSEEITMALEYHSEEQDGPELDLDSPDAIPASEHTQRRRSKRNQSNLNDSRTRQLSRSKAAMTNKKERRPRKTNPRKHNPGQIHHKQSEKAHATYLEDDGQTTGHTYGPQRNYEKRKTEQPNSIRKHENLCSHCLKTPIHAVVTPCDHIFCFPCIADELNMKCSQCELPQIEVVDLKAVPLDVLKVKTVSSRQKKRRKCDSKVVFHSKNVLCYGDDAEEESSSEVEEILTREECNDGDSNAPASFEGAQCKARRDRKTVESPAAKNAGKRAKSEKTKQRTHTRYRVGTRFKKTFDKQLYEGRIVALQYSKKDKRYRVHYKDGDSEDLNDQGLDELEILQNGLQRGDVRTSTTNPHCQESSSNGGNNEDGEGVSPKIPIGTLFVKKFPSKGIFEGEVLSFDGDHYKVRYSFGGYEKYLSESDFDNLEDISLPFS